MRDFSFIILFGLGVSSFILLPVAHSNFLFYSVTFTTPVTDDFR